MWLAAAMTLLIAASAVKPFAMANGLTADAAINSVIAAASHTDYRQLLAVDNTGQTAIFSGSNTLGINAECQSQNAAAFWL